MGRSWNELRFLAADRQKWKELIDNPYIPKGTTDLIIIIIIIIIIINTVCGKSSRSYYEKGNPLKYIVRKKYILWKRSRLAHGALMVPSRYAHVKLMARSRYAHGKHTIYSWLDKTIFACIKTHLIVTVPCL